MSSQLDLAHRRPRPLVDPLLPSLGAGAASGLGGVIVGGAVGILRSDYPVLFSTIAGAQCFALGTSFFYSRSVLLSVLGNGHPEPRHKLVSSGAAGAISGALVGALRSRGNIIPGAIMMTFFGLTGQTVVHSIPYLVAANSEKEPLLQRLAKSRWIPLKAIPDADYEKMLNEKLVRVEADIALIDEQLDALHPQHGKRG